MKNIIIAKTTFKKAFSSAVLKGFNKKPKITESSAMSVKVSVDDKEDREKLREIVMMLPEGQG